jgi:hypothetical protein
MHRQQKEERESRSQHEWQRRWAIEDFRKHEKELHSIHKEWKICMDEYFKTGEYPDIIYQKRNGGMSKEGAVIHDTVVASDPEKWQKFDFNRWKMAKYQAWLEISMTQEEKELQFKKSRMFMEQITKSMKGVSAESFKPPVQEKILEIEDVEKCQVCSGEKEVTYNSGYDNEHTKPCHECVGYDDSDYSGVSGER